MTVLSGRPSSQKRPYAFWHEYIRPWKLATYAARGGYQAQVLTGHSANDEKFTGGVQGAIEA